MIGASRAGQATLAALLSGLLLIAVACGQGGKQAGGSYPTINGIPCDLGERLAFHIHAHVAIYAGDQPLTVPYGIGMRAHELIQLDVGDETPPQPFAFPTGPLKRILLVSPLPCRCCRWSAERAATTARSSPPPPLRRPPW